MLKLYRDKGHEGLIGGASGYVTKLETWLRLAGIPYEATIMTPAQLMATAPRNMIPYVDLNDERIDDSSIIIDRLKVLHDDPLNDNRLTDAQHAQGQLIKTLCEYEMYYILMYARWKDGDYKAYAKFFFSDDDLPDDQREEAEANMVAFANDLLHKSRLGRYDSEFVQKELRKCLDILSMSLGDGPWLFGDAPSTYDATLYGFLAAFIHNPFPSIHVQISREYDSLVEYCDRIRKTCYDYNPNGGEL